MLVMFDAPNVAIAVGTMAGAQFAAVFQSLDPRLGKGSQVAFCASAAMTPSQKPVTRIQPLRRGFHAALRNDRPGHRLAFVADLSARRWAQHRPAENLFERLPAASPFREPAAERPSRTWVMSAGRVFNMIVRSSQRDMFLV